MQVTQGKNARSTRVLKKRQPLVNENVKKGMFIKGHKTSQIVNDVLNDLYCLKKPEAIKYNKKKSNTQHGPFESTVSVEFFQQNRTPHYLHTVHTARRDHTTSY